MSDRQERRCFPRRWIANVAGLFIFLFLGAGALVAEGQDRSVQIVFGGLQCYKTTSGIGDDQPYAAIVAADLRSGKIAAASHAFGDVGEDQLKKTDIVVGHFSPLKQVDDLVLLVAFAERDREGTFDKRGIAGALMVRVAEEKITPIVKKYRSSYSANIQWRTQIVNELTKAMSAACAETLSVDDLIGIETIRLHAEDIVGPGSRSVERTAILKGDGGAYTLYFDIKSSNAIFATNPPEGGIGVPVLPTLTGKWNSNLGAVELVQNGKDLTGTVNFPNQVIGKITGKIGGHTIEYKWFVHAGHQGHGKLTISSDGKKLSGNYLSAIDPNFKGPWTLTRLTGLPPNTPAPKIPAVVGVWQQLPGNTGLPQTKVIIGQEANQPMNFACRIPDMKIFAKGKIAADLTLTASFGPPNGDMSDFGPLGAIAHESGKITQVDTAGRATRIEWNNGVVYERQ